MLKLIKRRSDKTGLPPGALVLVGERQAENVDINIFDYNEDRLTEISAVQVTDCHLYKDSPTVSWININGIHDPDILSSLGEQFNVHTLVLEDIMNTGQRPKLEEHEDNIYIVMKMLYCGEENNEVIAEQISFIAGPSYVISLQEYEGDVFNTIRERLRTSKGRIRKSGADYLLYALIDAVVDQYFTIIEKFADDIENLEDDIVSNPTKNTLRSIQTLKRELLFLRSSVRPLREVLAGLGKLELRFIGKKTVVFYRDVYDHIIEVMEAVETYREMLTGMLDIYLSGASNRMNEVMKTLTIFASIFIPLTFIAGIYGMNFDYMPELHVAWGYPAIIGVMFGLGVTMAALFKRKGWF